MELLTIELITDYKKKNLVELKVTIPHFKNNAKTVEVHLSDIVKYLSGREHGLTRIQMRSVMANWLDRIMLERVEAYQLRKFKKPEKRTKHGKGSK